MYKLGNFTKLCVEAQDIILCSWKPSDTTGFTPPSTEEDETDEVAEGQALEVEIEEELNLTREQRDIKRTIERIEQDLIDRPDAVPNAEKQLLILLKRAQEECYFGVEQGAPIQAYALFGIPEGSLYIDDTDFSKYTQLGKIAKLIQACINWDAYRVTHLGQQYSDIADADEAKAILQEIREKTRQDFADAVMVNITKTDEYMNRAISPHDILEEAEDATNEFCTSQNFGNATKLLYGCNVTLPDNQGGYVETTSNPVMQKFFEYKNDPENAVGEPRYDIKTNAKCYTLESFAKQYELDEEARRTLLTAGGCTVE